ncbi:MAG: hypothetical protein P8H66_09730 [Luminiphilus sp.]|nr:hypothetical protein [Luminiphilus sp.]
MGYKEAAAIGGAIVLLLTALLLSTAEAYAHTQDDVNLIADHILIFMSGTVVGVGVSRLVNALAKRGA